MVYDVTEKITDYSKEIDQIIAIDIDAVIKCVEREPTWGDKQ